MAIIKKKKIKENKCQQGYREKGTLEHHWCEWILIMAIMGNRMEFPEKVELHYDLAIPCSLPHYCQ